MNKDKNFSHKEGNVKKVLWVSGLVTLMLAISSTPARASQEEAEDLSHRGILEQHRKGSGAKHKSSKPTLPQGILENSRDTRLNCLCCPRY